MWGSTQAYEYKDSRFYKAGTNTQIGTDGFAWTNYTEFGPYTGTSPDYGFTKYNSSGPTKLEPIDDAATIEWGSPWRMPTGGADGEFQKLNDNCTWTWKATAPKGYLVTGQGEYAGISVFFPAAGYGSNTSLSNAGSYGTYWSSSLDAGDTDLACLLSFYSDDVTPQNRSTRYYGFSVRPVSD